MLSTALTFLPFAFVLSITPGPNNVMVTASGANFGYWRTVPHMLGITAGVPVMMALMGAGLGELFLAYPVMHQAMKHAGALYLLYFAWRVAHAGHDEDTGASGKPMTFLQGALFQWINVKAWFIAIGAVTTYTTVGGDTFAEIAALCAVFALACYPSVTIWTLFGMAIRRWLTSNRALKAFNWSMAALLVLSLIPALS
ncbi:MAG: LysE family translocator [Alphaproteobacteria bacterium]|nr:LysE family translocator [Alphaproteobacteria bacterium]